VSSSGCSSSISSEEEITSITTNLHNTNKRVNSSNAAIKNPDYLVLHASPNIHSPIVLHESPMVQVDSPPPIRNENQFNKSGQQKEISVSSLPLSSNSNKQQFRVVALFGQNFKNQNNLKCENLNLLNCKSNPQTQTSSNTSVSASNLLNDVILNHHNRTLSLQRTIRPNRPPDYETTLKRIGLIRTTERTTPTSHIMLSQMRPTTNMSINVNVEVNDTDCTPHSPPLPPPPPPHLLIAHHINQEPSLPSPQSVSSDSSDSTDSNPHSNHNQNSQYCKPTRYADKKKNNSRMKKSVSFSDHVILVACAEEDTEEYIPNPIMERVLGKAFFNKMQEQSCK